MALTPVVTLTLIDQSVAQPKGKAKDRAEQRSFVVNSANFAEVAGGSEVWGGHDGP